MNALSNNFADREFEPASLDRIMAMAGSAAQELSVKWPFAIARIHVSLFGALGRIDSREKIGAALTLGLSGIMDSADSCGSMQALAFQRRIMAIRLCGRKIVAFHPERDVAVRYERLGIWRDRLRADVRDSEGRLLGGVERILQFPSSYARSD